MPSKNVVYKITHIETGKYYIGSSRNLNRRRSRHLYDLKRGAHGNITLQQLYNMHNGTVRFEVLHAFDTIEEARAKEEQLIQDNIDSDAMLNITNSSSFGDALSHHPKRALIIAQRSKTISDNMKALSAQERKDKYGLSGERNGMYGRHHSDELKAQQSQRLKGKPNLKLRGIKRTEEHKSKISAMAKQRIGDKNSFFGKSHTEETKQLLREKATGRSNKSCWRSVSVEGIFYESSTAAARALGISPAMLVYKIKSSADKYKNYKYCE